MKDQILKTAKVVDQRGLIYSIGSFGGRVNFYAQQNRALNLIWALREDGQLRPENDVAVIGGGVTGMTLAAGLVAIGCRVDVFEGGGEVLRRQLETQHRMAHPTINNWPRVAPDLTTALPFLEWHFGKCDGVAQRIATQFEELRSGLEAGKERKSQLLVGVTADAIVEVAANLAMVKSDGNTDEVYRLVLIAVGFGKERSPAPFDTPEYWDPDQIERDRNSGAYKYFVVSGAGDGGLIDALRIAHPDFGHGRLAFEMAAELFGTAIADIINAGEDVAAHAETHDPLQLRQVYQEAAEILVDDPQFADTHEKLWASLKRFKRLVYVTDNNLSVPFSRNAAPIHKLLVAHAKRMGRIDYAAGSVSERGDHYLVGGHLLPRSATKVVIRHGANPESDLRLLLSEAQFKDLESKQKHLADHVITGHWTPYPPAPGFPRRDPSDDAFIRSRRDFAEDVMRQVDPRASLLTVANGFEVTFRAQVPPIARGPLFGIHTSYRSAAISTGFAG